jgi:hypothetical protein
MKVSGDMLKTCWAFGDIFWAISIFLFRKSFLLTFFAPLKWLQRYHTRSLERSILILDQVQSRFQLFLKSRP